MPRILTILYFFFLIPSVLIKGNNHLPIYHNHFSAGDDKPQNIESYLDEIRAQVGRFTAHQKNSKLSIIPNDSAVSFACWIKPGNTIEQSGTLLSENDIFNFRYLSTRQIQFNHYNKKDIDTQPIICADTWQHLGFTLNAAGILRIYYNGDCIITDSINPDWHKNRSRYILGNDKMGVAAQGLVDDVLIYKKELSDKEIKQLYLESKINGPLQHKLLAYFPLEGNSKNNMQHQIQSIRQHIYFTHDEKRGLCADFKNDSCFIDFKGFEFDQQMTVSCWLKPIQNNKVMAIIGNKNLAFRLNAQQNALLFTVPMLYTSYSKHFKTDLKEWMHIAISVSINHKVDFYINGVMFDSKSVEGKAGNNAIVTVGRSIWKNNFNGKMSQLALWNRALGPDEIRQVYNGKLETIEPHKHYSPLPFLLVGIIAVLAITFVVYYLKNGKNNPTQEFRKTEAQKNAIHLIHTFKAYDKNGIDISNQFSPTLIRLLSLIILYPILTNNYITSAELSDILWETDSPSQQKNNRSTNIHRLRRLLENFRNIELSYQNREWKLLHDNSLHVDIHFMAASLKNETYQYIREDLSLCRQLKTNSFDSLIEQYEQKYITLLQSICTAQYKKQAYQVVATLAKSWTSIAPLSEIAHKYLISALLKTKQNQSALNTFASFSSRYVKIFNEEPTFNMEDCNRFMDDI
ncbi:MULTISPECIES: LamG-like jellyroll fold domain-containing protein [unclassified Saccharicrinis]|uniref:LamG-like jellyroll fold domain-containing protein n=1 Tax=unclassified Saccharicrinis TaxID=2646859 RepID=UPI003D329023